MKKYIVLLLFFINFAFAYQHGKMEVTAGIEMKAQSSGDETGDGYIDGYDEYGYDEYGYDVYGYDVYGYDEYGYDVYGYDEYGYDEYGYDEYGYDEYGYDEYGYDEYGLDEYGYDEYGYDEYGYNVDGYDYSGKDINGNVEAGTGDETHDKTFWESIVDAVSDAFNWIVDALSDAFNWIVNAVADVFNLVVDAIGDAINWLDENIIGPIWDYIQEEFHLNPTDVNDKTNGRPGVSQGDKKNWCAEAAAEFMGGCHNQNYYANAAGNTGLTDTQVDFWGVFKYQNFTLLASKEDGADFTFDEIYDYLKNQGATGIPYTSPNTDGDSHTMVIVGTQLSNGGNQELKVMDPATGTFEIITYSKYQQENISSVAILNCK